MSDSSQGSGTPKPAAAGPSAKPAAPPLPARGVTPPIRPKAPAAGIRPRAPSAHDHSVPEARRAREPLPDEATVTMRRSDHPPSMPAEDGWNTDNDETTTGMTASIPRDAPSPSPSPKPANVMTDANVLRAALLEVLEPLQHSLDELTLKIARERVDRKEAIDKLERAVARVATGNPPPVTPFAAAQMLAPIQSPFSQAPSPPPQAAAPAPVKSPAAAPAAPQPKNTLLGMSPQARAAVAATATPLPVTEQPYSVSPSAAPPPVAPVAAVASPVPAAAPQVAAAPVAKPASPAPPPVAAAVRAPVVVTPSSPPIKIDFDYSTDLSFELPPGLDGSRRKRILAWMVAVIVVGGAIAMIVSMIISRSRPPGSL